ncbi:hypothetical protein [Vibrio parahaemolyticus]|uniref:hypothetical protein n=1 Tax=Vibrio parahaemolyticus TaxID=670 RepID=UPI001C0F29BB|nr:hypothetical protein [Vibrio parahaemolyticus]
MSLFQCEECGCVENTACCSYHIKNFKPMTPPEYLGRELCCVCGPSHYVSGEPIEGAGKWHNHFKRIFLPKGEWKTNRAGNLEHIVTGETDYMKHQIDVA